MMVYIILVLFGLIFGSFISAVSYRIPRDISFVKGRSRCPKCNHTISWYDNIPIFSYILLDGKCRNCKSKISLRYPVIESLSAIGFVAIYLFAEQNFVKLILLLIIFLLFLLIFIIDLEHQIIPDPLVYLLIVSVATYTLIFNFDNIYYAIFPGLIAASFLMFLNIFTKGRGMGLGDVKLAVAGGILVGLKLLPIWLLTSFLTGAVFGVTLILIGKAKLQSKIAFGPFLITGILITIIFGSDLLKLIGLM